MNILIFYCKTYGNYFKAIRYLQKLSSTFEIYVCLYVSVREKRQRQKQKHRQKMPFTTFSYRNILGRQLSMSFSHFCTSSEQRPRPLFWIIISRMLVQQTTSGDRQFLPLEQKAVLFFVLGFVSGIPDNSVGKESTCNAGNLGLIPGLERPIGEGIGCPLQYSWASLMAQMVKTLPAIWETWVQSLGREDPWRRERLPTPVFWSGEFHGLYSLSWTQLTDSLTCFIVFVVLVYVAVQCNENVFVFG